MTSRFAFVLVSIQISILGALVALTIGAGKITSVVVGCWFVSAIILLVAKIALSESFTPSPIPNEQGLRRKGIYAYIRHPMYFGLLVYGIGCTMAFALNGLLLIALIVILSIKINYEETMLRKTYPDYLEYQETTKRLIPWVW